MTALFYLRFRLPTCNRAFYFSRLFLDSLGPPKGGACAGLRSRFVMSHCPIRAMLLLRVGSFLLFYLTTISNPIAVSFRGRSGVFCDFLFLTAISCFAWACIFTHFASVGFSVLQMPTRHPQYATARFIYALQIAFSVLKMPTSIRKATALKR